MAKNKQLSVEHTGMSRRAFLGLGATAALGAGLAAVPGVALAADEKPEEADAPAADDKADAAPAAEGTQATTIHNVKDTSWMTPPAEVTDFAEEIDCDVVVCGMGFAGVTAYRELAEEGKDVHMVEKQEEESFHATGNEFASLNASILQERGVPEIDPVEFYQNFMKITGNMANPELIMKFAQHSAENSDWYLSELTDEDFATMTTAFFPPTEHQMSELSGIKFWPSVCSFYGECNQTKIVGTNRQVAEDNGGTTHFGTSAEYIIMNDGKVAGLVAKKGEDYVKFNCQAVVCSCGGMGGNADMMAYFMPDMAQALVEGENLNSMSGNDGTGVKMAYWAGAHLENTPIAGMNMKGLSVPGKMNCLPQAVWIDEYGKRFCNEYYPTSEQRGYQTVCMSRKTKYAVVDNNFTDYRQYTLPQHAGFSATEENIQALRDSLDEAYAKFQGTWEEPAEEEGQGGMGGPMTTVTWLADDTLEGLADQLGLVGKSKENFIAQIADYNTYCENGVDLQFGRAEEVLFPVKEAPFYACVFNPELGETMVTMGGIITDGNQNALDKNYEPIPGLYVSGNDCGRRFPIEYVTPIPGCSLGFALVLGRECGKSVAEYLNDPESIVATVEETEAVAALTAAAAAGPGGPAGGPGEGGPEGEGGAEGAPAEGGAPADDKAADDKAADAAPAEEKETVDCSPCHGDAHKPGDENPHGY